MLGSATKKNIIATAALEWHPPHASTKVKLWGRAKTQALEVQELFFFNLVSVRLGVWVGAGMRRLAVGKDRRAEGWGLCWRLLAPRSDLGADKHVWRGLPVRDHLAGQWQWVRDRDIGQSTVRLLLLPTCAWDLRVRVWFKDMYSRWKRSD